MSDKDYEPNEGQTPAQKAAADAEKAAERDAAREMEEEARRAEEQDLPYSDEEIAAALAEPDADALRKENEELNERVLRLAAELENTRRRAELEKKDANKYAITNFARDLLSVADNFERALAVAPDTEKSGGEPISPEAVSGLVTGMRMTEKELIKTLERYGVVRISPKGEKFDPNIHQAVAQAPAAGVPSGHVAEVAQTGFVLGERVLRAAMVVVSTGEPADGDKTPSSGEDKKDGAGAHVDTSA